MLYYMTVLTFEISEFHCQSSWITKLLGFIFLHKEKRREIFL